MQWKLAIRYYTKHGTYKIIIICVANSATKPLIQHVVVQFKILKKIHMWAHVPLSPLSLWSLWSSLPLSFMPQSAMKTIMFYSTFVLYLYENMKIAWRMRRLSEKMEFLRVRYDIWREFESRTPDSDSKICANESQFHYWNTHTPAELSKALENNNKELYGVQSFVLSLRKLFFGYFFWAIFWTSFHSNLR